MLLANMCYGFSSIAFHVLLQVLKAIFNVNIAERRQAGINDEGCIFWVDSLYHQVTEAAIRCFVTNAKDVFLIRTRKKFKSPRLAISDIRVRCGIGGFRLTWLDFTPNLRTTLMATSSVWPSKCLARQTLLDAPSAWKINIYFILKHILFFHVLFLVQVLILFHHQ